MSENFEFLEDKTYLKALPDTTIPEKSIEGWFYKRFPGSVGIKKMILLLVIALLFGASIILFLLSIPNSAETPRSISLNTYSYEIL